MHRGECSTGDLQARAPQVPGSSEPLAPSQGDVLPRGPAPSGESCGCQRSAGERGGGGEPLALLGAQFCAPPPRAASRTGCGMWTGLTLSRVLPPRGVCAAGVMRGSAPNCSPRHSLSAARSLSSDESCLGALLLPGPDCRCCSGKSPSQSHGPWGPPSRMGWLPLGDRGDGSREKVGAAGGAGATGCQQRVVLPHVGPPLRPFAPPWGPWKLDLMFFPSQVTRSHLTSPQGRRGSSSRQLAHRTVLG